jgi:hypothetical protein
MMTDQTAWTLFYRQLEEEIAVVLRRGLSYELKKKSIIPFFVRNMYLLLILFSQANHFVLLSLQDAV